VCAISALAANLARWIATLRLHRPTPQTLETLRRQLLVVPGRLVHHGRRSTQRLPARWPWQTIWLDCLQRLRALPARC
jgi:hypothetical protein